MQEKRIDVVDFFPTDKLLFIQFFLFISKVKSRVSCSFMFCKPGLSDKQAFALSTNYFLVRFDLLFRK